MEMPPIANIHPTILYLIFALSLPNIFNISKFLPLDRMIGDFSYPFYLIHWLMLHIVFNSYLPHFNWPKVITFIYSIIISYILIMVIEKRMNAIRIKFSKHSYSAA
jgi:peptidoglycan/LPS O-acetylase OafA/YrhL